MSRQTLQPNNPARPAAIIIFVDIRGFSQWSKEIDANENTLHLVEEFQEILKKHFIDYSIKSLGDGAMLVRPLSLSSKREILKEIDAIVAKAVLVEGSFAKLTERIFLISGNPTEMKLGWGVTRGQVIKQVTGAQEDFLGHHVNKAARLCDLARPSGIVIDRDDFAQAPTRYRTVFYEQTKRLMKPYEEVKVWVSREINETFQTRELLKETPEVHIAGVCIKGSGDTTQILIAKRSQSRNLYPNKWEGCGGQLRHSETFYDGVRRHYATEMRVEVEVIKDVSPEIYSIEKPAQSIIPGLRFICSHTDGEPRSPNHSEWRWISIDDLTDMPDDDFPPDFKSQALSLVAKYQSAA